MPTEASRSAAVGRWFGRGDVDVTVVEDGQNVVAYVPQGALAGAEQFGESVEAADAAVVEHRSEVGHYR